MYPTKPNLPSDKFQLIFIPAPHNHNQQDTAPNATHKRSFSVLLNVLGLLFMVTGLVRFIHAFQNNAILLLAGGLCFLFAYFLSEMEALKLSFKKHLKLVSK